ncbi:MAG TPA: deoxynucleoside kinase [Anaerolineales bacterium]|nr:deoxynucleoside kinase [Anaerolineales bacterium]
MSGSTKRFVLVAGNIGSGKTSLTERLGQRLGWKTAYESVQDNPYLADFYTDMRAWAFHLQIFFLGHRARMHLALARGTESAIVDRSIYEDAEIFARASLELGNVSERDYQAYRTVYQLVIDSLPPPDLLLFLKAPVPVLMRRIRERARDIERGVSADYLTLLDRYYEEWLSRFDLCPVLTLRTDDLDFVHKPRHLEIVIERMYEKLAGREEVAFPSD